MKFTGDLKKFGLRVRFLRLWRYAAIGLLASVFLAFALIVADNFLLINFPILNSGYVVVAGLVLGAVTGFFLPVSELALARSVDRRAGNQDRLATALQKQDAEELFTEVQQQDAAESLQQITPKAIYPFSFGRWQMAACASCFALAAVVWVVQSEILLSTDQKAQKSKMEQVQAAVERIVKQLEVEDQTGDRAAEKKLAAELRKFSREMERGKLNQEQAMQKAQKLAEEAKKLTEQRLEKTAEKMEQIQAKVLQEKFEEAGGKLGDLQNLKLDKMQMEAMRDLMQKSGADKMPSNNLDSKTMEALGLDNSASEMMRMSEQQKDALAKAIAQEQKNIQEQMQNGNLTAEQMKALQERQEMLNELSKQLQLSEDVMKALRELQEMKEYKELQEMLQTLQKATDQIQNGEPLTEEQIKEMQRQMEELAKQMKDPKAREAMRQAMKEMIEQLKSGQLDAEAMRQLMGMMGAGMSGGMGLNGMPGSGGRDGGAFQGEGENQKGDPMTLDGKGNPTAVRGSRDENRGTDAYTEIKAPTMVGSRTSVPYKEVLPQYKKSAESAVNNNQVKPKHRQRVKEYFESLSSGGSSSGGKGGK
ncbi:MAG: hypothetical protein KF824_07405 [Fimbriimonadaceae bacterium]|nr:MAG: hypothetical protein KF824_07405 [Fimbriimonadaceae bacterium]